MTASEALEALMNGKAAAVMGCTGDIWYRAHNGEGYACRVASNPLGLPNRYEPYRALVFADACELLRTPEVERRANWGSFDVNPEAPDVTTSATSDGPTGDTKEPVYYGHSGGTWIRKPNASTLAASTIPSAVPTESIAHPVICASELEY